MPKNRATQSKLKHNSKNTITRKNKYYNGGGGDSIAQQLRSVEHRDNFRSMFNNMFHNIYKV
jgi:hypothetical protein